LEDSGSCKKRKSYEKVVDGVRFIEMINWDDY